MKINVKALMIFSILVFSTLAMPLMAFGADDDGDDEGGGITDIDGFGRAFGGYGIGGELLATIFEMLFLQTLALDEQEMLDGVYVLHANKDATYSATHNFTEDGGEKEIHFLPYMDVDAVPGNDYDEVGLLGGATYCEITRDGSFNFTLTVGASITLIIWDDDGSFITAAKKIIDFGIAMDEAGIEEGDDLTPELLAKGIELILWLLVHINDIFTGDELFVLNPITYQKLEMTTSADFAINKVWKTSDDWILGDGDDDLVENVQPGRTSTWNTTAQDTGDSYMQWLCTQEANLGLLPEIWTHFSFDIIQLWIKNFHIEIDVGAIADAAEGGGANAADMFGGLDIEFFLYTHHLEGAFLYNDTIPDGKITIEDYVTIDNTSAPQNPDGSYPPMKDDEGRPILVPNQTEISHRLMLGDVDKFEFLEPEAKGDDQVNWGIRLIDAELKAVPVGVDLNSYLQAPVEQLPFIEFKLQFIKDLEQPFDNRTRVGTGKVKLEHNFAPWNPIAGVGQGPNNPSITTQDLAIVYVSMIFHFHLSVATQNEAEKEGDEGDIEPDYESSDDEWKIGNYVDPDSEDQLEIIDIAGKGYDQGQNVDGSGTTNYDASTMIVPIGFWSFQGDKHKTEYGDTETSEDDFSADISLKLDINFMYYGVCYPNWKGSGAGIWHDPTFTVYMVFTPTNAGFWALILLIAGVGLVGIATILIKRKKDREF